MELSLTPKAAKFIERMLRFNGGTAEHGFRLVVTPGGCSGLSSEFSVEAAPRPGDEVVMVSGLQLFLPTQSTLLLAGATIDFRESLMESGFAYITPNAAPCACSGAPAAAGKAPYPAVVKVMDIQRRQ